VGKFLIAVGGSGQEIALASLRLCHLAGTALKLPEVYVFDSDKEGTAEDKKTPTRYGLLTDMAAKVVEYRLTDSAGDAAVSPVSLQQVYRPADWVETLGSLFFPGNAPDTETQMMLDLLLTDSQQTTHITDGFHGRPVVGAAAFGDYLVQRTGRLDLLEGEVRGGKIVRPGLSVIRSNQDESHFIALAGGTGGGTGTSVLPVLAQEVQKSIVAERGEEGRGPGSEIQTSLILQAPWFKLSGQRTQGEHDLDLREMQSNAACLVKFYYMGLEKFADRMVLLGLPEPVERESQGPNRQFETCHYLNLISGFLALQMMANSQELRDATAGKIYGFALSRPEQSGQIGKVNLDEELGNHLKLTLDQASGMPVDMPLKRIIGATQLLVAFSAELGAQLRFPSEPALTAPIRALVEMLGQDALGEFRKQLGVREMFDREILGWFFECFKQGETDFDLPRWLPAFGKSEGNNFGREQNALRNLWRHDIEVSPPHRFVSSLIDKAMLLETIKSGSIEARVRTFHRRARDYLIAKLSKKV